MTVAAVINVPAEEFLLSDVISSTGDIRIEFEPVVPVCSVDVTRLWVAGSPTDEVDQAFQAATDVRSYRIAETENELTLVYVEWRDALGGLSDVLIETEAAMLAATWNSDQWTIRLRFAARDELSTFYRQCAKREIALDIRCLSNAEEIESQRVHPNLSNAQYETLRVAVEKGYFAIPRKITLQELADELGVSDTAASQRLRRGLTTLLTATLPFS